METMMIISAVVGSCWFVGVFIAFFVFLWLMRDEPTPDTADQFFMGAFCLFAAVFWPLVLVVSLLILARVCLELMRLRQAAEQAGIDLNAGRT